ncbi:outer membrane beta-barrel protein [Roseivirga sp. E12]|uniref:outer membrane beta-barrel protein n=1 Tax=Roseivirga sp. E12 TaxID=2819237 RepID=UPI001ABCD4AC|nr:outer membrane beta-barrel protein [Roseivirga sp. E12]MBO3699505.1 outer membrane beta-barrel protein [Roseivirga sp. E12]
MDEAKNGDRLEQLVREAAEGAQFEFNPSAWSAMEKKLDAPKKGFFWWKLWGGLGLLAVIILLIIYIPNGSKEERLDANSSLKESTLVKEKGDKDDKSGTGIKENSTPSSTNEEQVEEKSITPQAESTDQGNLASENAKAAVTGETEVREVGELNNQESSADNTVTKAENSSTQRQATESVDSRLRSAESTALSTTTSAVSTSKVSESVNTVSNKNESNSASAVTYFDPEQPLAPLDSIGRQEAELYEVGMETIAPRWVPSVFLFDLSLKPMTLDTGSYQTADLDSLQTFKRWSFGVLVSLDLSATGLEGFTDPGNMIGLLAEYRLSRNWSIQSGLSYSVKNYSALGEEYDTSTWPGGRSDNLVSALARCLVIDIPINVRRYFAAKNDNQWFVSTGLSTYLMLREDYEYEYTRPSPNWAPTGQIRGENNHFFGIANFSVGYETPINKRFGLAVEPFMKLPLTGIGQGKVKFLSFGANVAIKLR